MISRPSTPFQCSRTLEPTVGVLSGLLYSCSATWRVLWLVLLAGAAQCFAGYFLMWTAVAGVIPRPPVPVMCLFMFVAAHAMSFFNTSNAVTGVRNFPYYKGTIVGIMKGFLGLSGAILFQIYWTFLYKKPASFLLMLALLPTINTLLLMWFVRIHKKYEGNEKKHLNSFSLIALIVAAYLMGFIILENLLTLCLAIRVVAFVVLILLLASPLCIAIRARQGESNRVSPTLLAEGDQLIDGESNWRDTEKSHIQDPSGYRHLPSNNTDRELDSNDRSLQSGENFNLVQAMCTMDFWILFIAMACGMGSGLATINNLNQIGGSLGYRTFEKSTLISLWSIWNFLGRFGAGYVSDHFLHLRGWARPLFIVITLTGMSIGHVVIASGMPCALYTGSLLVGVFYGSQWSLMPTITSEIFGVLHMGTIFNAITIGAPVGSYIFSVRVIGHIYDKEASTAWNTCTGAHCFRLSFLIMACATFLGSLTALALFFRTISFYSQDIDGTSNT
ncbi:hypothetical protein PRUPE_5G184300 [Prunus persica]|uniref:Uncharacterized protein n=1 Tax=Prunus persica TaxID=3760 RepID=A0A251PAD8_PRUPE|nr:hypothetical protein PRUPE_5G184300 [Prunus persica]